MAAFATPAIEALTVENTSGGLAQLVEDTSITELTVTGTMDARDFLFITQELTELTSLDLSQVTITEVAGSKTLYGTVTDYPANDCVASCNGREHWLCRLCRLLPAEQRNDARGYL